MYVWWVSGWVRDRLKQFSRAVLGCGYREVWDKTSFSVSRNAFLLSVGWVYEDAMTGRKLRSPPVAFGTLQHMRRGSRVAQWAYSTWGAVHRSPSPGGSTTSRVAGRQGRGLGWRGCQWLRKEGAGARKLSLRFVRNRCWELPALRGCGRAGSHRQAGAAEVDYQLCGGERPAKGHWGVWQGLGTACTASAHAKPV